MTEKLVSLSDKISKENLNKISFDEYINQKVADESKREESITKEDLKKEISQYVNEDLNDDLNTKIDLLFKGKDSILIKDLCPSNPEKENQKQININKINPSDLDLLVQEIPKEIIKKNEPLLELDKKDEPQIENDPEVKEEKNEQEEEGKDGYTSESIIKPSNEFSFLAKDGNKNQSINESKEKEKTFLNENSNKEPQSYLNEEGQIIFPANHKKTYSFLEETTNRPHQIREPLFIKNNDYFYNIFRDSSTRKKKIQILSDKINKIANYSPSSDDRKNNILLSPIQKNKTNDLYSYRFNTPINHNVPRTNVIKEKIEKETKLLINTNPHIYSLHPKKKDKKKVFDSLLKNIQNENERKKVNHEIRKKNDNDYDALSKQIELFRTKRSSNNNNNQEESERIQKIKQEMLMSIEGTKTQNENVNEKK